MTTQEFINKIDITLNKLFQTVSSDDKYVETDGFMLGLDYSDSISLSNISICHFLYRQYRDEPLVLAH